MITIPYESSRSWVLYHADCLDGFGAAWAAWQALGEAAHYQPVRHGDPLPELPTGVKLYILDFCYPPELLCAAVTRAEQIVVLDHHISAQTAYERFLQLGGEVPSNLRVHFDQAHSGCVLSWNYFHADQAVPPLLAHLEDRDLWRHQLPGTQEINLALYSRLPVPFAAVESLPLSDLRQEGTVLRRQQHSTVQRLLQARHPLTLLGVEGLAVNAPPQFASDVGEALAHQSGTFGLIYHYHGGRGRWECSLRSQGDFDVAALASRLGGGGHRNAAGFTLAAGCSPWQGTLKGGTDEAMPPADISAIGSEEDR
jgi:hypothetical protein